ncbi:hypothetical protein CASFOL_033651 [Castilleja foliolosa]|uniref:Uncharacterized protein n=1 Tax=Castilleja foliolosa TaxID=1961234 RepID=A0ABD3BZZ9_9LAMI
MSLRRSGSETQILNPRTDMDYFLEIEKMSLPRCGSETQIIKTRNRFDKQSVSYGCEPELPDFHHPVKCCSYIGKHDKSLLAHECELETEVPVITCVTCDICGSTEHDMFVCEFRERCPWNLAVGEDFEVACLCSNMDCTKRCSYPIGRVKYKHPICYWKF